MSDKPVLQIRDLTFSYNKHNVLEDINLEVQADDYLAILGPNGGGKSTLFRLILGLLTPDSGEIILLGGEPCKMRKYVGYVPQLFNYDYDFPIRVEEVILAGNLSLRSFGRKYSPAELERLEKVLDMVGMQEYRKTQIGSLSGGQRQRIFIARALINDPKLLLLDEPVANVDQKWQSSIYELLYSLHSRLPIIVVTHDIGVISTYIDKIACLNKRMHFHGKTKDGMPRISEMYECPLELVAHEVPHRLLHRHQDD